MRSIGPKSGVEPERQTIVEAVESSDIPLAPRTFESTGLSLRQVTGLILKTMNAFGHETLPDISQFLKLPPLVLARAMRFIEDLDYVDKLGSEGNTTGTMRYKLSHIGRRAAADELELDRYIGPAPVCLTDYRNQIGHQSLRNEDLDINRIRGGLEHLSISDGMLDAIGPAIVEGHSCLFFGPPGNGKSLVARSIVEMYNDTIYVPYAMTVGEEIIRVYDPTVHRMVDLGSTTEEANGKRGDITDERWVACHRPIVVTGGELSLEMLDLTYNSMARTYNASHQLKANSGIIVIDDFGRQSIRPEEILNRWIIPLEEGHDYLSLATGGTFQVPFDAFVVFSTNLDTDQLFDAATRRRIRYKITFGPPDREEFEFILSKELPSYNEEQIRGIIDYLYTTYFDAGIAEAARFQPKWIVNQVETLSRFNDVEFEMSEKMIDRAMANL